MAGRQGGRGRDDVKVVKLFELVGLGGRRTCPTCVRASGSDGSANNPDDVSPPSISSNWREFRAVLVKGSNKQHEDEKASAYRAGHWAHPVCFSSASDSLSPLPASAAVANESERPP